MVKRRQPTFRSASAVVATLPKIWRRTLSVPYPATLCSSNSSEEDVPEDITSIIRDSHMAHDTQAKGSSEKAAPFQRFCQHGRKLYLVNRPKVQPELGSRLFFFFHHKKKDRVIAVYSSVFGFFHGPLHFSLTSCLSLPGAKPCTDNIWLAILTLRFLGKWHDRRRANPRRLAEAPICCLPHSWCG